MIQNCTCGFAPSDLQIGPIQLKPSKIYNYGYAELIPFPNKVFGTSYIGTDNNAYSIFIKDGVVISTDPPTQINQNSGSGWKFINNCKVNEQMYVIYQLGYQAYGQMMNKDGTTSGPNKPILKNTRHWLDSCIYIGNNKIMVSYSEEKSNINSNRWLSTYRVYDIDLEQFGDQVLLGEEAANEYEIGYMRQLVGINSNQIVAIFKQIKDGVNTQGLYMQQVDVSTGLKTIGKGNVQVYAGNDIVIGSFDIAENYDGGFSIVFDNGSINMVTYDNIFTEVCRNSIAPHNNSGIWGPKIKTHYKTGIVIYQNNASTEQYIQQLDIETCLKKTGTDEETIYTGASLRNGHLSTRSDTSNDIIFGILSSDKDTAYYSEYLFKESIPCSPVQYCVSCYTGQSTCDECQGSSSAEKQIRRRSDNNQCSCQDGYYHKEGELDCLQCDDKCVTCSSSSSNCQSCQFTVANMLPAPDCICKSGYFFTALNTCEQCDTTTCVNTCSVSKFNCDECQETYLKQGNTCEKCISPCKTCTSTLTNCDSCIEEYYLSSNQCIKCPHPFITCTDELTPISCKTGLGRLDISQKCKCSSGYFEKEEEAACGICESPCKTCSDTKNTCKSCENGYVLDVNTCKLCPHPYFICSAPNTPSACKTGIGRLDLDGDCQCGPGYYEKGTDDCGYCQYPCKTCVSTPKNCTNCDYRLCATCQEGNTVCSSFCDSSCHTCNEEGKCTSCQLGEYLSIDKQCIQCPPSCSVCDPLNKNICLVCPSNQTGRSLYVVQNQCPCLEGYYEDSQDSLCKPCQIKNNCKKCDQNGICQVCRIENLAPPLCNTTKQQQNDISQHFEMSPDCVYYSHLFNRESTFPCYCLKGYHDNNKQKEKCIKCPQLCSECENDQVCTDCIDIPNLSLNEFTGKCECNMGFKWDNDSQICVRCYKFEQNCLINCPTSTRKEEKQKICLKVSYSILDNVELIIVCSIFIILGSFVLFFIVKRSSSAKSQQTIANQQQKQKETTNTGN